MADAGTILITGSTGQVGGALVKLFPGAAAPGRADLDLASEASIRECVRTLKPRWIINPAAYTAVDKAESDTAAAQAINGDAPRILGEEAAKIGATVVHYSTDYVFDGTKSTPYFETDAPHPMSVYGATKLAGEQGLAASGSAHVILRTSWVYGATGKNFMLTILKFAKERPELKIVADQHGAPTWSHDLARVAAHIVSVGVDAGNSGVYHASGTGETTWFGFAQEFLRLQALADPATPLAKLLPIPSSDYPTPAKRPTSSRMDCTKLERGFGFQMPAWQESLAQVFTELKSS